MTANRRREVKEQRKEIMNMNREKAKEPAKEEEKKEGADKRDQIKESRDSKKINEEDFT